MEVCGSYFTLSYCSCILKHAITGQDDLQGRTALGSNISVTPPPGISKALDRSPSVTPPEAWGGEASERSGLRQPTMSRFEFSLFSWYYQDGVVYFLLFYYVLVFVIRMSYDLLMIK